MEFTIDDLIFECVQKNEVASYIAPLVENGCDIKLVMSCDGYQVFAKGNIPEEYKF